MEMAEAIFFATLGFGLAMIILLILVMLVLHISDYIEKQL